MVSACIIAIGDELLNGFTIDSNSHWIKSKLSSFDVEIQKSIIIPDRKEVIKSELDLCIKQKYNYIFISGGLGPTHDDLTKKSISEYLSCPLIVNQKYFEKLKKRFSSHYKASLTAEEIKNIDNSVITQAQILEKSDSISNFIGTALGMTFIEQNSRIFVLPGVPKELRDMLTRTIIPKYFMTSTTKQVITLKTTGITETNLFNLLKDTVSSTGILKISFLPHFTGVNVRIEGHDSHLFDETVKKIKDKLNDFYYGCDNETIEYIVSRLLMKHKISLSIAESCTGGLISKKITDVSGSSKYFKGGVVAYSNTIKERNLGISSKLLEKFGAVSEEVAAEMCRQVADCFNTDIGLSITGISGPSGGSKNKPVGTCYVGLFLKGETLVKKFIYNMNDRSINRDIASFAALNFIRLKLKDNK